jgi:hypothetical protein
VFVLAASGEVARLGQQRGRPVVLRVRLVQMTDQDTRVDDDHSGH